MLYPFGAGKVGSAEVVIPISSFHPFFYPYFWVKSFIFYLFMFFLQYMGQSGTFVNKMKVKIGIEKKRYGFGSLHIFG